MGNYRIRTLNVTSDRDYEDWERLVNRLPFKDTFITPEYAQISKAYFKNEPQLFVYGNEDNYITYFFIKRRISELPFITSNDLGGGEYFDIISPEYGGPVGYFSDEQIEKELFKEFFVKFDLFCEENNIVSEFCRLNPFLPSLHIIIEFRLAEKNRDVVYIDLTKGEEEIWNGFRKGTKSSTQKGLKSGVKVSHSKSPIHIQRMYEIYTHTMERNKAKEDYFHSKRFFELLIETLGDKVEMFVAEYDGRTVSASLFLTYGDVCHYFLSGTDEDYFRVCPNDVILYEAIRWAKKNGFRIFHLGGGYQPNDGLFHFKSGFSKTFAEFFVYKKIHNLEYYNTLCLKRDKYEKSLIPDSKVKDPGFFPEYRRN